MAWYDGMYRCGHDGRVNVIGPHKDRQFKIDREFEKLCPECWEKHLVEERERVNAEAAAKAKEMELPELTGSEKQVAWANTLRQRIIDAFDEFVADESVMRRRLRFQNGVEGLTAEEVMQIRDYIITAKTSASYFIDTRDVSLERLLRREAPDALKCGAEAIQEQIDKAEALKIRAEATVYPEKKVTETVTEIQAAERNIIVRFPERLEEFRVLVRGLGYTWNSCVDERRGWSKPIKETTGSVEDRVAELGNKLLNAGFPILIMDPVAREKAISGDYEPECQRWIYRRVGEPLFAINWKEYDDRLYRVARCLPGSRWSNPSVIVPVEHYKAVQEFAELYGFRFTRAAQKLMDEFIEVSANIQVVKPADAKEAEKKDGLKEILESSTDVIDDLKEEGYW